MRLPKLYHKRKDGKIQTWEVEVEGPQYRVFAGIKGGKTLVSAWTVCQAKNVGRANETTPETQAVLEAQSEWTKKVGGKYCESEADIDTEKYFEPMKALTFADYQPKIKFPLFSQRKMDGIRVEGSTSGLHSRKGKRFVSLPHILEAIQPVLNKFPDLVLDGEGYADKFANNFNEICSIIRSTKLTPKLLERAKQIQYCLYDCFLRNRPDMPFSDRLRFLEENLTGVPYCLITETKTVASMAEADKLYEQYMEEGYEGQILRVDGPYTRGYSPLLLKRKEFQDAEFIVLGYAEGVGNRAGMLGSVLCQMPNNGLLFHANVKGSRKFLIEKWDEQDKLIGQQVTIAYAKDLTPAGAPRFPRVTKWNRCDFE